MIVHDDNSILNFNIDCDDIGNIPYYQGLRNQYVENKKD